MIYDKKAYLDHLASQCIPTDEEVERAINAAGRERVLDRAEELGLGKGILPKATWLEIANDVSLMR